MTLIAISDFILPDQLLFKNQRLLAIKQLASPAIPIE